MCGFLSFSILSIKAKWSGYPSKSASMPSKETFPSEVHLNHLLRYYPLNPAKDHNSLATRHTRTQLYTHHNHLLGHTSATHTPFHPNNSQYFKKKKKGNMLAHLDIKLWHISALWFKKYLMRLFVLKPHNLTYI